MRWIYLGDMCWIHIGIGVGTRLVMCETSVLGRKKRRWKIRSLYELTLSICGSVRAPPAFQFYDQMRKELLLNYGSHLAFDHKRVFDSMYGAFSTQGLCSGQCM